jgi:hypothetical protein
MREPRQASPPLPPLPPLAKDSTFQAAHAAGGPLHPLPPHREDGTLPPTGEPDGRIRGPGSCSPYFLTVPQLVTLFGTTGERLDLLEGLFDFRAAVRRHGFTRGFQWIGGSFVRAGGRPRDIDLACFVHGSIAWKPELRELCPDVFGKERVKERYRCDARFVDLRATTYLRWMIYWWHVYSARKPIPGNDPETQCDDHLGFVEVSMVTDDADAQARSVLADARRKLVGDAA